jgi:cytokinesis protein
MEAAGLANILERCRSFQFAGLDKQLDQYDELYEEDHTIMRKNFDEEILRDMSDPYDVYRAIMANLEGTEAFKYFLSAMQHLLLVREEGDTKSRYFQLIDTLVTSVVLDKKPSFSNGLSNTIGLSVERLVAQFGESERAQALEKETSEARVQLGHLKLEKETLERELAAVGDGLVGQLKERLAATEEKLRISRLTTEALQEQLKDQQSMHEEQIQQLELQISELFKMLKESRGFASAMEASKGMDRKDLIYSISKQMERKKTIGILEGRRRQDVDGEEDESDAGPVETGMEVDMDSLRRRRRTAERRRRQQSGAASGDNTGRTSQFMDAEEERVRLHIEETLAAGAELMVSVARIALFACLLIQFRQCIVSTPFCISFAEGTWAKWFPPKNGCAFGCRRHWWSRTGQIRFCYIDNRVHKGPWRPRQRTECLSRRQDGR